MFSKSILERVEKFAIEGKEPLEALKLAIQEENKFILEIVENKSERSEKAREILLKNIYGICNIIQCKEEN
jgi:hypothetical protein